MADGGLLASAALGGAAAALLGLVGVALLRRPRLPEHRAAGVSFACGWLFAGALSALNAVAALVAAWSPLSDRATFALAWIGVVLGMGAIGGVLAYVVYLLTGRRAAVPVALAAQAVFLCAVVVAILALEPVGAQASGWMMRFQFAHAPDAANQALALGILAPMVVAMVAYVSLAFRVADPTARWRTGLVGGALGFWLVAAIVARLPFAGDRMLGVSRLAGALAALGVFLAYWPPRWAQRRFGVRRLEAEILKGRPSPTEIAAREAALAQRAMDLI